MDLPPRPYGSSSASGDADVGSAPTPTDRVLLLECRLEQLLSSLTEARAEADRSRTRLAEAAAREAEHARRQVIVQEELAAARAEVAALHRRLERSEALRAEVEGRLFEAGSPDTQELVRLRREASGSRGERDAYVQTTAHLRARIDELVASREVLFTRVVEWVRLVREGDAESLDLAEFIAALRRDILELEHQNFLGERREAELRRRLVDAVADLEEGGEPTVDSASAGAHEEASSAAPSTGPDDAPIDDHDDPPIDRPDDAPIDGPDDEEEIIAASLPALRATTPDVSPLEGGRARDLVAALAAAHEPQSRIDLLLRLGRCGEEEAFYAVRPHASASDPGERAAAYQALGRLLERDPSRLEPYVRWGIADADPRVRRRVILAAATARGLELRPLLETLRADPDAQVRRVVNEVLRRRPPVEPVSDGDPVPEPASAHPISRTSGVAS